MIGLELEILAKKFDRFGWDRDRGSHAHDRILADWMDALQDYPLAEVQAACRRAVVEGPHRMPNEGHIVALIREARRQAVAGLPKAAPEPERVPVSAEAARSILKRAGFRVNRFGGVDAG